MADYLIHDSTLEDIADAIRAKTGGSSLITPEDMPSEIESIETGGGTLRTTHYNGIISFNNTTSYSITIPFSGVSETDIVTVIFRVTKTGTVTDGVITWNDSLTIPTAFGSSSSRLTAYGMYRIRYPAVNLLYSDGTVAIGRPFNGGTALQLYNKNSGNSQALTATYGDGTIKLQPNGWNGTFCRTGVVTEYTYDVYIMTSDGNALTAEVTT